MIPCPPFIFQVSPVYRYCALYHSGSDCWRKIVTAGRKRTPDTVFSEIKFPTVYYIYGLPRLYIADEPWIPPALHFVCFTTRFHTSQLRRIRRWWNFKVVTTALPCVWFRSNNDTTFLNAEVIILLSRRAFFFHTSVHRRNLNKSRSCLSKLSKLSEYLYIFTEWDLSQNYFSF